MPVDINLLLAIDIIWVGSRLPEGGSLSVLPAGSKSASREARWRTPARKPGLPVTACLGEL